MSCIVAHPIDDENVAPIPRTHCHAFGVTEAKTFPPFVFGVRGLSCLVHKVRKVELHWWRIAGHGHLLVKMKKPVMFAQTNCQQSFRLDGHHARTCHIPAPNALPCGRCRGEESTFPKKGRARKYGLSRQEAHVRLGCVVKGY